jgi:AcrR family transcriptional regulator
MARSYTLRRRAERQAETQRRIVQAAVALHTTLGPARTSISAIADLAGVQRHTVYAHFPDEPALFRACSAHFRELHPFPALEGLELEDALDAIYRYYERVELPLTLFTRDAERIAEAAGERRRRLALVADGLAGRISRRKLTRAAVGHAIEFETWRSLVREQGLTRRQAVAAMAGFVRSV